MQARVIFVVIILTAPLLFAQENKFERDLQISIGGGAGHGHGAIKYNSGSSLYGVSVTHLVKWEDYSRITGIQVLYGRGVATKWIYANIYGGIGFSKGDRLYLSSRLDPEFESFSSTMLSITGEAGVKLYYVGIGLIAGFEASKVSGFYGGISVLLDIPFGPKEKRK